MTQRLKEAVERAEKLIREAVMVEGGSAMVSILDLHALTEAARASSIPEPEAADRTAMIARVREVAAEFTGDLQPFLYEVADALEAAPPTAFDLLEGLKSASALDHEIAAWKRAGQHFDNAVAAALARDDETFNHEMAAFRRISGTWKTASCDTHAKRGDAVAAPSLMGSAVASADDRRPTNIIRRARTVQQTRAGKQ